VKNPVVKIAIVIQSRKRDAKPMWSKGRNTCST
jgi:hypothetical protein